MSSIYGSSGDPMAGQTAFAAADRVTYDPSTGKSMTSPTYWSERHHALNDTLIKYNNGVSSEQIGEFYNEMRKSGQIAPMSSTTEILEDRARMARSFVRAHITEEEMAELQAKNPEAASSLKKAFSNQHLDDKDIVRLTEVLETTGIGDRIRANFDEERIRSKLQRDIRLLEQMGGILGANGQPNAPIGQLVGAVNAITSNSLHNSPGAGAATASAIANLGAAGGLGLQGVIDTAQVSNEMAKTYGYGGEAATGLTTYAVASRNALQSQAQTLVGTASLEDRMARRQMAMGSALDSEAASALYLSKYYEKQLNEEALKKYNPADAKHKEVLQNLIAARETGAALNVESVDEVIEAMADFTGTSVDSVSNVVESAKASGTSAKVTAKDATALKSIENTMIQGADKVAAEQFMETLDLEPAIKEEVLDKTGMSSEALSNSYMVFMEKMRNNPKLIEQASKADTAEEVRKLGQEYIQATFSKEEQKNIAPEAAELFGNAIISGVQRYGESRGAGKSGGFEVLSEDSVETLNTTERMYSQANVSIQEAQYAARQQGNASAANTINSGVAQETIAKARAIDPAVKPANAAALAAFFAAPVAEGETAGLYNNRGEVNSAGGNYDETWKQDYVSVNANVTKRINQALDTAEGQRAGMGLTKDEELKYRIRDDLAIQYGRLEAASKELAAPEAQMSDEVRSNLESEVQMSKSRIQDLNTLSALSSSKDEEAYIDAKRVYSLSNAEGLLSTESWDEFESIAQENNNSPSGGSTQFTRNLQQAKKDRDNVSMQLDAIRNTRSGVKKGLLWGTRDKGYTPLEDVSDEDLTDLLRFMNDPVAMKEMASRRLKIKNKKGEYEELAFNEIRNDPELGGLLKPEVAEFAQNYGQAMQSQMEVTDNAVSSIFGTTDIDLQNNGMLFVGNPLGRQQDRIVAATADNKERAQLRKRFDKFNAAYLSGSSLSVLDEEELRAGLESITGVDPGNLSKEELIERIEVETKDSSLETIRLRNRTVQKLQRAMGGAKTGNNSEFIGKLNEFATAKDPEATARDVAATALDSTYNFGADIKNYDDYSKWRAGQQKDVERMQDGKEKDQRLADLERVDEEFEELSAGLISFRPEMAIPALQDRQRQIDAELKDSALIEQNRGDLTAAEYKKQLQEERKSIDTYLSNPENAQDSQKMQEAREALVEKVTKYPTVDSNVRSDGVILQNTEERGGVHPVSSIRKAINQETTADVNEKVAHDNLSASIQHSPASPYDWQPAAIPQDLAAQHAAPSVLSDDKSKPRTDKMDIDANAVAIETRQQIIFNNANVELHGVPFGSGGGYGSADLGGHSPMPISQV
jgi:hypothetical protein